MSLRQWQLIQLVGFIEPSPPQILNSSVHIRKFEIVGIVNELLISQYYTCDFFLDVYSRLRIEIKDKTDIFG